MTAVRPAPGDRRTTYVSAISDAMGEALEGDSRVFLAGEDVATAGSVFGIFRGLLGRFGPERVIDTPISEAALVGLGCGAGLGGLRPVIDIMFIDFFGECLDQVANQLAKIRYMSGGVARLPVTITTMAGAGASAAAQHSQSLEAWLAHVPGLKVVMPSTPHDAKGLLLAAISDDDPVVVIFNKLLLGTRGEVPPGRYEVPIGHGTIARAGSDATIIATGRMVREALAAAEILSEEGIELEVVDPRTLQPLDTPLLVASARKTGRVIVVHEAVTFGGIGAEIAAQVTESAFDALKAPVARLGAPFAPVPFSPPLEAAYLPTTTDIVDQARRLASS